jgi:hypothetical protein
VRGYLVRSPALVLAIAGLLGGGCATDRLATDPCRGFAFDGRAWRESAGAEPGSENEDRRARLADRLAQCQTLRGRSKAGVRELLGRPDSRSRSGSHMIWNYFVYVGEIGDDEFLTVEFDAQGRVIRTHFKDIEFQ